MKKILAFLSVVLILFSLVFSLSSCSRVEDIEGAKKTESNLKLNYYETTLYDKNNLSEIGAEKYLKYFLKASNDDGDTIMICYCKSESSADKVFAEFETMADESDEGLVAEKSGTTVVLGTKSAIKCSTKTLWKNQIRKTFFENENYMYVVEGLGNTLIITLGALLIGVSRTAAAEFTFFLAIPTMLGKIQLNAQGRVLFACGEWYSACAEWYCEAVVFGLRRVKKAKKRATQTFTSMLLFFCFISN